MNAERYAEMRVSYGRRHPLGVLGSPAALPRPEEKWSRKDQLMQTEVGCWAESQCPRELAQGGLCAIKKISLGGGGVSPFKGLCCISRALGRFCRAEAATSRVLHKQHPGLPKQPGLIFMEC